MQFCVAQVPDAERQPFDERWLLRESMRCIYQYSPYCPFKFVAENMKKEQPAPLKVRAYMLPRTNQVCVGRHVVRLQQFKTGIHKVHVRKGAAEVAETSTGEGMRQVTWEKLMGPCHSEYGKSRQLDPMGVRPVRNSQQSIPLRG